MKKVFFFDVDGTLLPHGNEKGVDQKTIYALNELMRNGHDVVLATGKSEQMIADQLAVINTANHITMNGAQIVVDNELRLQETIDQVVIDQLVAIADQHGLMLGCQKRDEYYIIDLNVEHELAANTLKEVSLKPPLIKPEFAKTDKISQLWYLGDNSHFDFSKPIVEGHRLIKWHDNGCDIAIDYVSKAFAIEKYIEMVYGDQQVETYAFGDGNNDIEMIQLVDNGVAMGNSVDALKQVADTVTDSCLDLGVYNYLVDNGYIGAL